MEVDMGKEYSSTEVVTIVEGFKGDLKDTRKEIKADIGVLSAKMDKQDQVIHDRISSCNRAHDVTIHDIDKRLLIKETSNGFKFNALTHEDRRIAMKEDKRKKYWELIQRGLMFTACSSVLAGIASFVWAILKGGIKVTLGG